MPFGSPQHTHCETLGADPAVVYGLGDSALREINSAFRRSSWGVHPDHNFGDDSAEHEFRKLGKARDELLKWVRLETEFRNLPQEKARAKRAQAAATAADPFGDLSWQQRTRAPRSSGAPSRKAPPPPPVPPPPPPAPLVVADAPLSDGTAGLAYSARLSATGGTAPYRWTVRRGALPAGLTLNSSTGGISGVPTDAGGTSFSVGVSDAQRRFALQDFSIDIRRPAPGPTSDLRIITQGLTAGIEGKPYRATLRCEGGTPPYSWFVADDSLSAGLQLASETGRITGVPRHAGITRLRVLLLDAANDIQQGEIRVEIASATLGPTSPSGSSGRATGRPPRVPTRARRRQPWGIWAMLVWMVGISVILILMVLIVHQ